MDDALARISKAINQALAATSGVTAVIENMAGQGVFASHLLIPNETSASQKLYDATNGKRGFVCHVWYLMSYEPC